MKPFINGSIVVRKDSNERYRVQGRRGAIVELIRETTGQLWTTKDKYAGLYIALADLPSDEIPPAPTGVTYNAATSMNTLTVKQAAAGGCIYIGFKGSLATFLEPDDALQLCHDLRRMAMDIKRKEKANA